MKILQKIKLCFIILLLSQYTLSADEIRVTPLEFWQQTSLWHETLTVDQLVESSIHASGTTEASTYITILNDKIILLEEYIKTQNGELSPESKGEIILHWMHEYILTGRYVTNQTKLDVLIDKGDYNCVSSAVLYLILTRAMGLDSLGEETKDHAFCTIKTTTGESIDVETTTIMGFDPGTKKEFGNEFEGRTGFSYVKPGDYSRRQPISDKKLISLILQNRLAFYQQRLQYDQAVGLSVDRWFFYPIEQHEKDMNDSFRNWVATLNQRGDYLSALDFLLPLSKEMGFMDANKDLISTLIYNQAVSLTNENKLSDVRSFLKDYHDYLTDEALVDLNGMIDIREIEYALEYESYEIALEIVRDYKTQERITSAKARELLTFLHQNEAIVLSKKGDRGISQAALDAYQFLAQLPREEADLPGISNHREQYLKNWAVYIHNDFVAAANEKNYNEAKRILTEALEIDSRNTLLTNDLRSLEKIMN